MLHFSDDTIGKTSYGSFIPFLKSFYRTDVHVPQRSHHHIEGQNQGILLTMPAWQNDTYIGIKLVTVYPENSKLGLATIQGLYLLLSAKNGEMLATFDGPSLTTIRTAAISALAADLLVPDSVRTLLMLGTGNLCTALVKAHSAVRTYDDIMVWGRRFERATDKAGLLLKEGLPARAIYRYEDDLGKADVVSAATYAPEPIIFGKMLKTLCHVDLVGSFTPSMREADDDVFSQSSVFVDDYSAIVESGDLVIPLKNGTICREDIVADLKSLVQNEDVAIYPPRRTVFKSVGNARSDLALAVFLYENRTYENG